MFRRLINYLRSCFCKHDWELIFDGTVKEKDYGFYSCKVYRCKKCNYSKIVKV